MANKRALNYPRRGEIYLVSFDPVIGAEIRKTRPALILQNDIANRHSPLTIVSAITSQFDEPLYPTEVLLRAGEGGTARDSVILLNQIRSVDKRRLVRRLGRIGPESMQRVHRSLQISLGLVAV
jgi:mRNA interferase MazF